EAKAEITINLLNYDLFEAEVGQLAREVSRRTSIDLGPKPVVHPRFDNKAREQGWIWFKGPLAKTRPSEFKRDMVAWLRRGGFLVVDHYGTLAELQDLTSSLNVESQGSGWHPIPPDHELMRSFHLLDSLPVCDGRVWQGFQFD